MSTAELVALMLADGRLPTGGHTQSAGLEPAVRAGLGADGKQLADVTAYARDRLRTVTRVEAATAVLARHITLTHSHPTPQPPSRVDRSDSPAASRGLGHALAAKTNPSPRLDGGPEADAKPRVGTGSGIDAADRAGGPKDRGVGGAGGVGGVGGAAAELGAIEGAWAARTSSQVLRGVARRQGRAYLRLAARVWPEVLQHLKPDSEVPRPIVIGVIGAVTGLSAEQVARIVAYDDVQSVVSASLKLLPVDPADAATWLAGLHEDIEELVADVAPLTDIEKIPANGAPLIDQFAQNHATERMRLFHA